ncbi:MAG: immunoglobulin-like domain-containing protein, partial [Candidatus Izemoplasmataceae bacterium]
MKKFLVVLLLTMFTFSLAACDMFGGDLPDPDPDPECEDNQTLRDGECVDNDISPPILSGVEDVEIFAGESFDPREGVTAIDDVDGDITADIEIAGTVNVDVVGTYFLRYSIEDSSGNISEETRYVDVVFDPSLIGDEMVPNGDFSLGWAVWTATVGLEGGNATYEVVDEELKITITGVSGGMWEPRLENQGITFEEGQAYRVSFDARAEAPRAIHVQIGELLPAAPYFTNFKPGQTEIFDLTTDMETYTFDFVMGLETNENGGIFFEMGTVPGESGTDNLLTVVYLDNVEIIPIDEFEDTI